MTEESLGEFDIIARYFSRRSARRDVLLGVGDDAAVVDAHAGRKLVVAMDTIVENIHFLAGSEAADVGYRALAVNLSDLAAMGAEPAWMTLSLSLPRAREQWLEGFASGLFELADRYDVALIGGDIVRGPLVITVQVAGWVEADGWLTRSGAKPGDLVFVSGIPGEAAAGLAVLQRHILGGEAAAHLQQRFLRPQPRIELGRKLRTVATAAMDVSDGLVADLKKLCAASGVSAQLNADLLPESAAMRQLFEVEDCLQYALSGGDDYELLFTLPEDRAAQVLGTLQLEQHVTRIGVITPAEQDSAVQCLRGGQPFKLKRAGHDHFARGDQG